MVRCYCLPGNPDKLGQHVVGHCPAAESDYVVSINIFYSNSLQYNTNRRKLKTYKGLERKQMLIESLSQ